jgi:signal transduction histidine kinase
MSPVFFQSKKGILCIRISDTGIGISEENLAHLFQPYVQADAGISRYLRRINDV